MAIFALVAALYTLIYQVSLLRSHSLKSILDASEPDYTADLKNGYLDSLNLESRNVVDKQSHFLVILYYEGEYRCLASLISDRLVLTAAHCVKDDSKLQDPGYFMGLAAGTEDSIPQPSIRFESIHVLPDSEKDDLAILVTRKIVAFRDGVGRICLSNDTTKELMYQNVMAISGAAVIDTENALKFSPVKVVSASRCGIKGMSKICVYGENTTLCKGDSGGPLIATSKQDVHFQIGILLQGATRDSTTHESTECSNLVTYNRVSHYSNFISQIANLRNTDICFVKL